MSELRQDILTGEWVFFASSRKDKPYDFTKKSVPKKSNKDCPFCPGHEDKTTPALYQNGPDNEWNLRVFPNMYPAVDQECENIEKIGFYNCSTEKGYHEVLVDTPDHDGAIHDFTTDHIESILSLLNIRLIDMYAKNEIRYVQIFKNFGADAGASINHSHWQIVGTPIEPKEQKDTFFRSRDYFEKNNRCLLCDTLNFELKEGVRIIEQNSKFVSIAPYAAKFSGEIWIVPKEHLSSYGDYKENDIKELSAILKSMLSKITSLYEGISYNICFMDSLMERGGGLYSHMYIRLLPRLSYPAGFEFATSSYINPLFPEISAKDYRDIDTNK